MDSDLFLHVLSSWEVIAVSIALILFLPLVFYVASAKTRRRNTPPARTRPAARPKPAAKPAQAAEEEGGTEPRRRGAEPPEENKR
jgi:hypothetical protein